MKNQIEQLIMAEGGRQQDEAHSWNEMEWAVKQHEMQWNGTWAELNVKACSDLFDIPCNKIIVNLVFEEGTRFQDMSTDL